MLNESIEHLKNATKLKPEKPSAQNNLALSLFEAEQFEESIACYEKAISINPTAVHRNNKGLAHYHADELHKALEEFSKALELDDNDPTIYFNRGNVYLN